MSKFYTDGIDNFFAESLGESEYYFVEEKDNGEFWFIHPYDAGKDSKSHALWKPNKESWRAAKIPADTTNPYLISLMQPEYKIKVNSQEEFEMLRAYFAHKGLFIPQSADWRRFPYRGPDKKEGNDGWMEGSPNLYDTPVYASLKDFFLGNPVKTNQIKLSNITAVLKNNGINIGDAFLSFDDIKLLNSVIK